MTYPIMFKQQPQQITIKPTYIRDSGLWVRELKAEDLEIPGYTFTETSLICIPVGEQGGNHKHPRIELFACIKGDLELGWLDENKQKQKIMMENKNSGALTTYMIPANLPHVVTNRGNEEGVLIEFATEKQHEVESLEVL